MNKLKIHHHGENVHSLKHNEELKSESDEWEEDPVKFLSKDRADEFWIVHIVVTMGDNQVFTQLTFPFCS